MQIYRSRYFSTYYTLIIELRRRKIHQDYVIFVRVNVMPIHDQLGTQSHAIRTKLSFCSVEDKLRLLTTRYLQSTWRGDLESKIP